MHPFIAIAVGGSVGAIARFWVAQQVYGWMGRDFPHGTLFVNVSGSFLMGLLTELMVQRFAVAPEYRAAILVGFIGAYTTFSTFALETLMLFDEGSLLKAFLNILLSTGLCLLATWVGLSWGRSLFTGESVPLSAQTLAQSGWLAGWILAFGLVVLATLTFHRLDWPAPWRVVALILFLGGMTVASTLWFTFRLAVIRLESGDIVTAFSLNGLCAAVVIGLATQTGNWLWQHIPSR